MSQKEDEIVAICRLIADERDPKKVPQMLEQLRVAIFAEQAELRTELAERRRRAN